MAQEPRIFGFAVTMIAVPPGATAAVPVLPQNNGADLMVQYVTGGSLELFNMPAGASAGSAPSDVTLAAGYLFAAAEKVGPYQGGPRFYLAATGATAVARLLVGLSEPKL